MLINLSKMIQLQHLELSEQPKQNIRFKEIIQQDLALTQLKIQGGSYDYYRWDKVFQVLKNIPVQSISVKRNYLPLILYKLLPIQFPNLKELNISQNRITSVSPLMFLQAPKLQSLILSENRIISLKSLRKLPFILTTLYIDGNPIKQLTHIESIRFKKVIDHIQLEQYTKVKNSFKGSPCLAEDAKMLVKFQGQTLKYIKLKKRIRNDILELQLNVRMSPVQKFIIDSFN